MRSRRARSIAVLVVAFVAFMAASLRVPFIPAAHAGTASVHRVSSDHTDVQALVTSTPTLRRADRTSPAPLHATSPLTALLGKNAWSGTDASFITERVWVPSAKTRAELMVFLN